MGFQGRPGPPGPHGMGEPGLPVSWEETVRAIPKALMFLCPYLLYQLPMGSVDKEKHKGTLTWALFGWHIVHSGFVYRDLKDHKVFKGKKDLMVRGFLDRRYYFESIVKELINIVLVNLKGSCNMLVAMVCGPWGYWSWQYVNGEKWPNFSTFWFIF